MFRIDRSAVNYRSATKAPDESCLDPRLEVEEEIARMREALAQEEAERKAQAEQLVLEAKVQAEQIIAEAHAQSGQIKSEAMAQGFAEGKAQADERQQSFEQEINREFAGFLSYLHEQTSILGDQMEENVTLLSLAIAEKIVNISLERDDSIFRRLIKNAIERMNARERFVIHLNPREYGRYFQEGTGWLEEQVRTEPFTVLPDPEVPPGGCVLKSTSGVVDAGIGTQLRKLSEALGLGQEDEQADQGREGGDGP